VSETCREASTRTQYIPSVLFFGFFFGFFKDTVFLQQDASFTRPRRTWVQEEEQNIVVVTTVEAAQEYLSQGYEGVELSLGNVSLGRYDHHGVRGHMPAVCLQAFEDLRAGKVEFKMTSSRPNRDLDACALLRHDGISFRGS
jgi:hypothetical protein